MKNIDILNAVNSLNSFVETQRASNSSFLSVSGQFAIKSNVKALMSVYEPCEDTLKELRESYDIETIVKKAESERTVEDNEKISEFNKEADKLLKLDVEVTLRKITETDFKEGCTFDSIMLLDFMTE